MLKKLTIEEAIRFEGIPLDIFSSVINGECICFGDAIDERTLSIAVLSGSAISKSDAILRYISVADSERFNGYADALLKYVIDELLKRSIKGIYIKLNEDAIEVSGHHEFLVKERFIPVCTSGRSLSYSLREVQKSEGYKELEKYIDQLPKTEKVDDWNDADLHRFLIRNRDDGLFLVKDKHSTEYSRVYKKDRQIQAAVFVSELKQLFVVSQIYWEKEVFTKAVLPALIGGCVKEIIGAFPDGSIELFIYDDIVYNGVTSLFGNPNGETRIYEYYRPLV